MCVVKHFNFLVYMFVICGPNKMLVTLVETSLLTKLVVILRPTGISSTVLFTLARIINACVHQVSMQSHRVCFARSKILNVFN